MYLLVFVTLVVALTGIYGEVMAVQTKELYAHQTTAANAMQTWHSAAYALVKNASPAVNTPTPAGCSLTQTSPSYLINACSNGGPITISAANLPPGYNMAYTFYSVYYKPANGPRYVVTFVPQPTITNPPPGFIVLPGGQSQTTPLGFTMSDLLTQIKSSGASPISYGLVSAANFLVTSAISTGTTTASLNYTLPSTNVVSPNSIALITSF